MRYLFVICLLWVRLYGISLEVQEKDGHVIHILTVDPKKERFEVVKAHNQVFGRETVADIAARKGAQAAVNGGFFEIGGSSDGMPTGLLIAGHKLIATKSGMRSCLAFDNNEAQIFRQELALEVRAKDTPIPVACLNQFPQENEIALFNDAFGKTTLTDYKRREIIISPEGRILALFPHGDNYIPENGWVLSFPPNASLNGYQVGDAITIKIPLSQEQVVMGIPMLVEEGKVATGLEKAGSASFVFSPQARTAFGIKRDGTCLIVVVEHEYVQKRSEITLGQVQKILHDKHYLPSQASKLTYQELADLVDREFSQNSSCTGLSLPELAEFMIQLGCVSAINLDGGGSSTLYADGKVVNRTFGDSDEGFGQKVLRPVSDAIVILK
jgi:exopolysaccharide biosynthesis protein